AWPRADVFLSKAIVAGKLLRRPRRAMAREILRRGAGHEPRFAELARHQIVRPWAADANREIEAFFHQIDHSIGKRHIEAYFAMPLEECGDRRRHVPHAEI